MRFFFFNDTATTEIYTLSLHDALPIYCAKTSFQPPSWPARRRGLTFLHMNGSAALCGRCWSNPCGKESRNTGNSFEGDRKSTRLNSSHSQISYAVFCLKKKNYTRDHHH